MKSFANFISEAKQVGTLYHYTDIEFLAAILKSNTLKSGTKGEINKISLTRDKNFQSRIGDLTGISIEGRITIDGTKLSHNYKIKPYHDFKYFGRKSAQGTIDEMEEVVYSNIIKRIIDYITEIKILLPDNILYDDSYKEHEYFPRYMKKITDLCRANNIPLLNSKGEVL